MSTQETNVAMQLAQVEGVYLVVETAPGVFEVECSEDVDLQHIECVMAVHNLEVQVTKQSEVQNAVIRLS